MSMDLNHLIPLLWQVIKDISVAIWIIIPIFWHWIKKRFFEWRPSQLEKNLQGAKDLEHVVNLLFQIERWLSSTQTELITNVRHDLCKVAWNIYLEALSYTALHSTNVSKRELALRNLSQVFVKKSVTNVIHGIADDKGEPKCIRKVAKAALKELKQRNKRGH